MTEHISGPRLYDCASGASEPTSEELKHLRDCAPCVHVLNVLGKAVTMLLDRPVGRSA